MGHGMGHGTKNSSQFLPLNYTCVHVGTMKSICIAIAGYSGVNRAT